MKKPPKKPSQSTLWSNIILLPVPNTVQEKEPPPYKDPTPNEKTEALTPPEPRQMEPAIEALLLAAHRPIRWEEINEWLGNPGKREVLNALRNIKEGYQYSQHGFQLVEVANAWQFRTRNTYAAYVQKMRGEKPIRLSKAALEALSIVAYRQPVTRQEVEDLRGVDCGQVIKILLEHSLISTTGRRKIAGSPLIYETTDQFLSLFGLRDLAELPHLKDLRELETPPESRGTDVNVKIEEDPEFLRFAHPPRNEPIPFPKPPPTNL